MLTLKMKKQKCKELSNISNIYFKIPHKTLRKKIQKEVNAYCLKRNNLENANLLKTEHRKLKKRKKFVNKISKQILSNNK